MRTIYITLLLLIITASTSSGQLSSRLGRTQAITNDWRPGFFNTTELTGGMGLGTINVPYSHSYFGITNTFSYQFMRRIKAGIGAGVQVHNEGLLIPVFLDGRFNFPIGQWSPFIAASGGYAMSPDNFKDQSRVFFNPYAGIKRIQKKGLALTFAAGVLTQAGGKEMRSSFINLKVGVEFKGKR